FYGPTGPWGLGSLGGGRRRYVACVTGAVRPADSRSRSATIERGEPHVAGLCAIRLAVAGVRHPARSVGKALPGLGRAPLEPLPWPALQLIVRLGLARGFRRRTGHSATNGCPRGPEARPVPLEQAQTLGVRGE